MSQKYCTDSKFVINIQRQRPFTRHQKTGPLLIHKTPNTTA